MSAGEGLVDVVEDLAVVVHGAGDLRVEPRPVRAPAADEAVVRVAYGGVCGSDLHYVAEGRVGESVLREPMVLGHEVVGTVERAAADGSGPGAGTPVAVHPAGTSDPSAPHPPGRPNLSPAVTYLGSAARHPHVDGAFARRVVLPSSMLRPLPAGLDLERAALAEPAAVAWHAVARAGDVAGKRALVVGCGPIGLLCVAVLLRAGAREVVVTDVQEAAAQRALALGAARAVPARDAGAVAAVGADVVLESSGAPAGFASAVAGAARGGVLVMVGLQPPGAVAVPLARAISAELDLRGSFRFVEEITDVLAALADGSLAVDGIVTHTVDVADAHRAFEVARDSAASGKVLLRF
ncbi:zinc-binding dehydrogenase [Kineococcus terrestris]|uniref:zinc-binding dehydrogenase n=1 Tax=Kineococcus terrestris TaxID=2044856 RepID=UPI0034DB02CE